MKDNEILSIKQRFGIIGNSASLTHAIEVAAQVAPTDMTVLITGESGSGKESFSKIIHQLSPRKHGKLIAINCGAIPEGTIDSELFGHEKGSFTGAYEARKGYFEVTDGGTIFLDEIAEMPLGTQARLLRVLENGEFIKVGSSKVQKTDVRVVAASNVELQSAVADGKFREDLYYRLSTVPINVPPLRDRGEDMLLLFRKFSSDFSEKYRVKPIQLTENAQAVLLEYRFPGNIRQLKNLVEQMSVLEIERGITADTLRKYLPSDYRSVPMLYKKSGNNSNDISERDILYKVLFDMKQDVTELKKLVFQLLSSDQDEQLLQKHKGLFKNIQEDSEGNTYILNNGEPADSAIKINETKSDNDEDDIIQDITHETEDDDSLSIEKKEKELIIKALIKNSNKRKYAAQDLGISERTLYRKIKQYQIDE
ncbi:MAG: sigma-54-dependent Fis family transcriptional regulator [Cyclobacteriaceae bacterium]|nr:MAG: sigma-54-dependent Fis family transcriptional regulator [Cyclobacteriaceae bacterium]